jgi:hypothetical protein
MMNINTNPNSKEPVIQNDTSNTAKGQSFSTIDPNTGLSASTAGTQQQQQQSQTAAKTDPVANANATSKRGYTYQIVTKGPLKSVIVKDKDGKMVIPQTPEVGGTTDDKLIESAKIAAGDN